MFDYTHENYFSFGYDGQKFNTRKDENSVLWANFAPVKRAHDSFRDECIKTAKLIRTKTSEDLYVLFSGGMDSEIVLRSFIEAGIEINAITVEFEDGLNEHDILWSRKFCKAHNVNHIIKPLNIEKFWREMLFDYASPVQCNSPQFPVTMWLIDQTPGFPIIGSGDSEIKRHEGTQDFVFNERENYLTLYLYLIRRNREGVPAFFQYTPELLLSFFEHPILKEYRNFRAKERKLTSISDYKFSIYQHSFPSLEGRPVFNGFERVQELDQHFRVILRNDVCKGAGRRLRYEFDEFIKNLKTSGCKTWQVPEED